MTRALRENNHLNLRQIQKQRTGLSDLSHKIQKQQSHIESLESFKNQVQYGMRDLQASLKRYQMKLESQMQGLFKIISTSKEGGLDPLSSIRKQQGVVLRHVQPKPKSEEYRMRDRLASGPTAQPQTYKIRDRQQQLWQSTIQPNQQFRLKRNLFSFHFDTKSHRFQPQRKKPKVSIWRTLVVL